jgi:hypothetical protein
MRTIIKWQSFDSRKICCFPFDAEDHSVNGRVNLQRYPEMVYGWCLPRILHVVAALREQYPDRAHSTRTVASPLSDSSGADNSNLGRCRLCVTTTHVWGAPNPPTWCAVSELVTDFANEIVWCTEWNPTVARSSMMSEHITAKRVGSNSTVCPDKTHVHPNPVPRVRPSRCLC